MLWCDLPRGHRRAPPHRETGLGRPPTATKPTYACAHTRTHTHKAPVRTREAHAKARVHARKHAHTRRNTRCIHTHACVHNAYTHAYTCTRPHKAHVPAHRRTHTARIHCIHRCTHAYTCAHKACTPVHGHTYTGTHIPVHPCAHAQHTRTRTCLHTTLVTVIMFKLRLKGAGGSGAEPSHCALAGWVISFAGDGAEGGSFLLNVYQLVS